MKAMVGSLVLVSMLVMGGSRAAFSASAGSSDNSWAAGTVSVDDDDASSAMFSAADMRPGPEHALEQCIAVTYQGSINPAAVRMYAANVAGTGLADWLDVTIEMGNGGGFGSCQGFEPSSTLFSGTLAEFAAGTSFAAGVGGWTPGATGESRVYRLHVLLRDDQAAQGKSAMLDFVWEAQST